MISGNNLNIKQISDLDLYFYGQLLYIFYGKRLYLLVMIGGGHFLWKVEAIIGGGWIFDMLP